ncbi:MAG TPA: sensor histidine kinase [Chthonomonadaceae bacterium]|nr:sensor histidine kinase [Chthonomonadaceae bacterium]
MKKKQKRFSHTARDIEEYEPSRGGWTPREEPRCQGFAERKRAEAQLTQAIREVHHRVKNNLQAVSALLEMQIDTGQEYLPVESVRNSLRQIKAIALVHDLLAHDRPIGAVDVAQVLSRLAGLLAANLRMPGRPVALCVEAEPTWMPTQTATSLTLIANELISNAIKHSMKERGTRGRHDAIIIRLCRQEGERMLLCVEDRGPGFPAGFHPGMHGHLGLELVHSLVTIDLHGRITFANVLDRDGECAGGRVQVCFPEQPLSP